MKISHCWKFQHHEILCLEVFIITKYFAWWNFSDSISMKFLQYHWNFQNVEFLPSKVWNFQHIKIFEDRKYYWNFYLCEFFTKKYEFFTMKLNFSLLWNLTLWFWNKKFHFCENYGVEPPRSTVFETEVYCFLYFLGPISTFFG